MATDAQRKHLAELMDWLVAKKTLIHYLQHRPMTTARIREQELADRFAARRTISTDCSETVTLLCRLAGLADPNGAGYNGSGWTGSMLEHLPHYSDPAAAEVGALVVFGPGGGDHVCMVRRRGKNPNLFSHGQEAGPIFASFAAEARAHKPPARFLSVAQL